MKNFLKAMDKNGDGFQFPHDLLPELGEAKVKVGVSVQPQIRKIMIGHEFYSKIMPKELAAWK